MAQESKQSKEQRKTENAIREAWADVVASVVASVKVKDIEASIGSPEDVADALKIKRKNLNPLLEAVRDAFKRGGQFEAKEARISFDLHNESAERWLREHSSDLITNITEQQREAIREVLESGMRQGLNPRRTALDIVGRQDKSGKRRGGIVGLDKPQARAVTTAREQLRSGDPAEMRKYLNRTRRDRRFDKLVKRAIEAGKPVNEDNIDRITGRYSDRLLKTRGDRIARTESMQAFHQARKQAWQQAIDDGEIEEDAHVVKIWRAALDERTRSSHAGLDGQQVDRDELFQSSTGARMDHPGDRDHGATAEDVINCRCTAEYKVRY